MDQQQFKVRMSVSTKLILLISFLLSASIFFLNLSAINLFKNDKKAYVYDSQATTAALAGREFVSYLDSAMSTLKLILGAITEINPNLSEQTRNNIKFYLDNQRPLMGAELYIVDSNYEANLAYENFIPKEMEKLGIDRSFILFDKNWIKSERALIESKNFFFKNLTRENMPPILAIVFGNPAQKNAEGKFALTVGYINLQYFTEGLGKSFNKFVILDNSAKILFSTDQDELSKKHNYASESIFKDASSSTFSSGAKEFFNSDGVNTLGSYFKPGLDLVVLTLIDYNKAMRATNTLTEKFMTLGLGALGCMIVLGLIFSKRLIKPLNNLFLATNEVSAGNFEINLQSTSKDEIGALTNSFVSMSRKISDLIKQMVDKVRLDQELEIAKTVQQSLFPPVKISNSQLEISSHYQSATECGGDWWGYFTYGSKHIFIIADATGHGLPSALMTASCRSCFSVIEKLAGENGFPLSPAEILSVANRVVYEAAHGKIMMTCFVGVMDFDTRTITYASAGHNPQWLLHSANGKAKITSLMASGQRLGETSELPAPYEMKSANFSAGDTLVLYTDGLIEGSNLEKVQFGKKRARALVESVASLSPDEMIVQTMNNFMEFNGEKPLDDDVTVAMVRVLS